MGFKGWAPRVRARLHNVVYVFLFVSAGLERLTRRSTRRPRDLVPAPGSDCDG